MRDARTVDLGRISNLVAAESSGTPRHYRPSGPEGSCGRPSGQVRSRPQVGRAYRAFGGGIESVMAGEIPGSSQILGTNV
jgi:hypothetical protein